MELFLIIFLALYAIGVLFSLGFFIAIKFAGEVEILFFASIGFITLSWIGVGIYAGFTFLTLIDITKGFIEDEEDDDSDF